MNISIIERDRQIEQILGEKTKKRLADGRWQVSWEIDKPRQHEHYILQWEW
jgi:hypothetical protein